MINPLCGPANRAFVSLHPFISILIHLPPHSVFCFAVRAQRFLARSFYVVTIAYIAEGTERNPQIRRNLLSTLDGSTVTYTVDYYRY
jgi:hypothetical protein